MAARWSFEEIDLAKDSESLAYLDIVENLSTLEPSEWLRFSVIFGATHVVELFLDRPGLSDLIGALEEASKQLDAAADPLKPRPCG